MTTDRENPKPVYEKGVKLTRTPIPEAFKPEPLFPNDWHDPKLAGKRRCLAWAGTCGSQCNNAPMRDRDYCRMHGGNTPRGTDAHSFKTGRYSQDLPKRLLSSYKASYNDPDILDLKSDIALMDSRLHELIRRVDPAEPGQLRSEAKEALGVLRGAMQRRDAGQTLAAMAVLEEKLQRGVADYKNWDEILKLQEMRGQAGKREMDRMKALGQTITVERGLILMSYIGDIIRRNVTDKETLLHISADLAYLIDHPDETLPPADKQNE